MVLKVKSADLVATLKSDFFEGLRCKLCGFLSETTTLAVIHLFDCKKRKKKIYECTRCTVTYRSKRSLVYHLNTKHKIRVEIKGYDKKRKFICHYCRKEYPRKNELHDHILGHMNLKPYSCDICGAQFRIRGRFREHIVQKHLETTLNDKTFPCSFCSKMCISLKAKRSHEYRHKNSGLFQCAYCSKTYQYKVNLMTHIQNFHFKTELERRIAPPKKFICDLCGNAYCRKSGLTSHYRVVHEGGKPTCTICGKKVYDKRSLEIHMNTHTGAKPHCCEVCGKGFCSAYYLRVHSYSHTGETPHVCHLCPKKFKQRSSYTLHYKTHHPGVIPPKLRYY